MGHVTVDERSTCQFSITWHMFANVLVCLVIPGHEYGYPIFYIYRMCERKANEFGPQICPLSDISSCRVKAALLCCGVCGTDVAAVISIQVAVSYAKFKWTEGKIICKLCEPMPYYMYYPCPLSSVDQNRS